jgi:hypothetical protein
MTAKHHIGCNFDDFLAEEGILEEVNAVAAKRVKEMQPNHRPIAPAPGLLERIQLPRVIGDRPRFFAPGANLTRCKH